MHTQTEALDNVSLETSDGVNKSSREFKLAALELLLDSGLSKNKVSQLLNFHHSLWDYWEDTDKWFCKELDRVKLKYGDGIRYRLAQFAKREDKIGMVTNFFLAKAHCDEHVDRRIKIDGKIQHNVAFQGVNSEPTPVSIDKSKVIDVISESLDPNTESLTQTPELKASDSLEVKHKI